MNRRLAVAILVLNALAVSSASGQIATGVGSGGSGVGRGSGAPSITVSPPPPPLPEGTGAISGVVADAATGRPVEGAIVALSVPDRRPIGRAGLEVTDARGRFVFTKLPARDDYQLLATRPGYMDAHFGENSLRARESRPIPLAEGQWRQDARLSLWKLGSISGAVVDERGDPVVGVYIRVLSRIAVAGTEQLAAGPVTQTDDRGAYRIATLGPGTYLVSVPSVLATVPASNEAIFNAATAPAAMLDAASASRLTLRQYPLPPPPANGQTFAYPIVFAPSATSPSGAVAVTLGPGEDRGEVNVRLEPVPAARVSGRVEGPADAVSGLTLRLLPAGLENLGSGSEAATTLVGPSGAFVFLNVPAGSYTLDARRSTTEFARADSIDFARLPLAPGIASFSFTSTTVASAPPGTSIVTFSGPGSSAFWARTAVTVSGAGVSDLVAVLHRTVSVSGRVEWEGEAPANARQVSLVAEPADGSASLGLPRQVRRPDLPPEEFSIEGLLPGPYVLRLQSGAAALIRSITWDGRDYTDRPFDAAAGHDFTGVRITLTSHAPTLDGVARNADGTPARGAAVIAFPVDAGGWSNYGLSPTRIKTMSVSDAGAFHFTTLPEGEYFVVALPAADVNRWQDPDFLRQAARSASRATLMWGQTTTVNVTIR